jgi:hypothetical protein
MINDDSNIAMSMINLGDPTGDFVTLSPELPVFIYAFFKPITAPTELVSQAVPQVEFPHFTATNNFLPPDFSLCQDNADVWIFSLKLRPPLLGFGICAIQTQRCGDQLPLQPPYIKCWGVRVFLPAACSCPKCQGRISTTMSKGS